MHLNFGNGTSCRRRQGTWGCSWLVATLALALLLCAEAVSSLDLGPIVRVAQCRSQCLKRHSLDGSCEWWRHGETGCNECWQQCETLEKQWGSPKAAAPASASASSSNGSLQNQQQQRASCDDDEYKQCPSCRTACEYRKSQVVEQYLPSMLPAPHRAPVNLAKNDVAVLMHKVRNEWRVFGYYPGTRAPSSLRHDEWIVAVVEDGGVVHFSWEEWLPTLDSLKEGPLFEATISWRDVDIQLKRQTLLEQKRFNDRVRQFFLEKYGEKVLEWRNQDEDTAIPEEVFRRFFFRRRDQDESGKRLDDTDNPEPSTLDSEDERNQSQVGKESFVVSWEPETGGLMGNQVADSNFAQISLLPGTKYLVRIASNEGPGSFPIEVDTRPSSIQVFQLKKNFVDAMVYPWAVLAASMCAAIIVCIAIIVKLCRRTAKEIEPLEVV
ncbi:uncharacterized protein LOC106648840 [Trichogramma pretiosum]|uniref:uncharacterized protein LOC106648840 n=1 Tax=Trichogramma pretiosum TaxID=7493 RepID=UPI0006C9A8DB|nr:uncharacterized protein LOC106648840 [Trichogramma pretiosum]